MSLALERKFILAISHRFDDFKQKSAVLFNAKCPLCGDGTTGKKKRGYFYIKDGHWWYYCHNGCGGMGIKKLLKHLDFRLFQQYEMEEFQTGKAQYDTDPIFKSQVAVKYDPDPATEALRHLPKISQLPAGHRAREYLTSRQIPNSMHSILRWCDDFNNWTNKIKANKFDVEACKLVQGRIIIPFFSEANKFFAYLGRVCDASMPRYILIVLDHDTPLIYGMNTVDRDKPIIAVEGPIDSWFLPNCVAMAGANLASLTNLDGSDIIVAIDNEPRKPDTVKKVKQSIDLGYKTCIWPEWMEPKDINGMIQAGMSSEYLTELINSHAYTGLEAQLKFSNWSKV